MDIAVVVYIIKRITFEISNKMKIKTTNIRLFFLFLLVVGVSAQGFAQSYVVKGRVSSDGKALPNVMVTDGDNTTLTNEKGQYQLNVSPHSKFIYVTTPSGFLPKDSLNVPKFYKTLNGKANSTYNFELVKNKKDDSKHIVLVHADPQFFKEDQFERYAEIIDDCAATAAQYADRDVFGIDCGDLSFDKSEFYSPYIDILNKAEVPFYRLLGNHDLTYGGRSKEKSVSQYEGLFGPTNYSFNRGNAHYIVLNNVFYLGRDYFYMGYLDEKTYRWIEQDLSYVPENSLVFISMHIPARLNEQEQPFKYDSPTISQQTVNIAPLFKMLESYNAHIFTGHMHYNRNIIHTPSLYEHNTAAICGAWWQGEYCVDGTPQGYGVYEVDGNEVKWYFKSAGHPREHQMRAYAVGSSKDHPEDVIVNVWNWDRTWKVEWIENGENRGAMNQFAGYDPGVVKMLADKEKLDFSWIGATKTDHLFKATPLSADSKIEIIVTDYFGEVFKTEL